MGAPDTWKAILLEAARQSYASSKQGVMLAKVPSILRQSGIEKDDILSEGRKLREFLASEASSELRLVQNEVSPLDWAILPLDLAISEPHSKYFPAPRDDTDSGAPKRFISAFWQGFTKHVPNGHKRWVVRGPRISIEDQVGPTGPVGAIEIERQYTAQPDEIVIASSVVMGRIEEWARVHGVDPSDFMIKPSDVRQPVAQKLEGQSMANMFKNMPMDEMSRISIPLDIVARYLASLK